MMTATKDPALYQAVWRDLIKSEIDHLTQRLGTEGGEECFIVTASVCDGSHSLLGSQKGIVYMEDFPGIVKGFLSFVQKGHATDNFSNFTGLDQFSTVTQSPAESDVSQKTANCPKLLDKSPGVALARQEDRSRPCTSEISNTANKKRVQSDSDLSTKSVQNIDEMDSDEYDEDDDVEVIGVKQIPGIDDPVSVQDEESMSIDLDHERDTADGAKGSVDETTDDIDKLDRTNAKFSSPKTNQNKMTFGSAKGKLIGLNEAEKSGKSSTDVIVDDADVNKTGASKKKEIEKRIKGHRKCKHCPRTFPLLQKLYLHLLSHYSTNAYKCRHCDFNSRYYRSLQVHHLKMHKKKVFTYPTLKEAVKLLEKSGKFIISVESTGSDKGSMSEAITGDCKSRQSDSGPSKLDIKAGDSRQGEVEPGTRKKFSREVMIAAGKMQFKGSKAFEILYEGKVYKLPMTEDDLRCEACNKVLRNHYELKEHQYHIYKLFNCWKCNKDFKERKDIRAHLKTCVTVPLFAAQKILNNEIQPIVYKSHSPSSRLQQTPQNATFVKNIKQEASLKVELDKATSAKSLKNNFEKALNVSADDTRTGNTGVAMQETTNTVNESGKESSKSPSVSDKLTAVSPNKNKGEKVSLFTCPKCQKRFKLRMILAKHNCQGPKHVALGHEADLLKDINVMGKGIEDDGVNRHDENQASANIRNVDQNKSDDDVAASSDPAEQTKPDVLPKYTHKQLMSMEIIDHTCPKVETKKPNIADKKSMKVDKESGTSTNAQKGNREIKTKSRNIALQHKKTHHEVEAGNSKKVSKSKGMKGFRNKINALSSTKRHYTCKYKGCGKAYSNKGHLDDHVVLVHTKELTCMCTGCNIKFIHRQYFYSHKEQMKRQGKGSTCTMVKLIRQKPPNEPMKKLNIKIQRAVKQETSVTEAVVSDMSSPDGNKMYSQPFSNVYEVDFAVSKAKQYRDNEQSSKLRCNTCGLDFTTESLFRKHLLTEHCGNAV